MRKTIGAIIQARMSSSRLPGKVLMELEGMSMLEHQINRVKRAEMLDKIIVCTSDNETDNLICELCNRIGVDFFRGSLEDVLDRFYETAHYFKIDTVVRLTADCPLIDPGLIDDVVANFLEKKYNYFSNCNPPTYPDGLDVEIFSKEMLILAAKNAKLPSHREHVTPFIKKIAGKDKMGNLKSEIDYSKLRWTVDNRSDFVFVQEIFSRLYNYNNAFTWYDVLSLVKQNPDLSNINSNILRNSGKQSSLKKDREFLNYDSG